MAYFAGENERKRKDVQIPIVPKYWKKVVEEEDDDNSIFRWRAWNSFQ